MKKSYSYIGLTFIILVFGIIFVPKIVNRISNNTVVQGDRLDAVSNHKNPDTGLVKIGPAPKFVLTDQNGNKFTQTWFKSCIVQRHVARVIQHATLPGETIASSLEQNGCKSDGTIPDYRKKSSGVK